VKKTILIAPYEGPFAAALAREALAGGWAVAVARTDQAGAPTADLPADLVVLPWNPSSYISASALVLAAKNAFGELDAAVLLFEPERPGLDLVGGKPGEIENGLHRAAIGPALLSRELLRSFETRRAGGLVLVDRATEAPGPAAGLAAGAFRGLGEGIFALASEAAWEAFGIQDKCENPADTARFALRLLEAKKGGKTGRWLRFTGKPGLFGIF
jgi:hypothetical protein